MGHVGMHGTELSAIIVARVRSFARCSAAPAQCRTAVYPRHKQALVAAAAAAAAETVSAATAAVQKQQDSAGNVAAAKQLCARQRQLPNVWEHREGLPLSAYISPGLLFK